MMRCIHRKNHLTRHMQYLFGLGFLILCFLVPISTHAQSIDEAHSLVDQEPHALDDPLLTPNNDDRHESESEPDSDAYRLEPALFPALGGDSDIGFLFGAVGILAKFNPHYTPYHWRLESLLCMSVGNVDNETKITTHDDVIKLDLPGIFDERLRLYAEIGYYSVVNESYYGIGNNSKIDDRLIDSQYPSRAHQYEKSFPYTNLSARYTILDSLSALMALHLSYVDLDTYPQSAMQIAKDKKHYGTSDYYNLTLGTGLILDTRDHETYTKRGQFHELSVRFSPGELDSGVRGGVTLSTRYYYPFIGPYLVFASRLFGDMIFGQPTISDLAEGGLFPKINVLGGGIGLRGIPTGRYHGKIKILANLELRSFFLHFDVGDQKFHIGAATFLDTGRTWAEYASRPDLDGHGLGLKSTLGGGLRIGWGETVLIRFDVAARLDRDRETDNLGFYVYINEAF